MLIKESVIEKKLKKIQESFLPDYVEAYCYGEHCRLTVDLIHEFTKRANETEDTNEQDYFHCLAALHANALLLVTLIRYLHEEYMEVLTIIDDALRVFVDRKDTIIIPKEYGSVEDLLSMADPIYEREIRTLYSNYITAITTLSQTEDSLTSNHLKVRICLFEIGMKVLSSLITFRTKEYFLIFWEIVNLNARIIEDDDTDDGFGVLEREIPRTVPLER